MFEENEIEVEVTEETQEDTALEARRSKFGLWADCNISVKDGRIVEISVDNILPDADEVIIRTNAEKVIAIMTEKVAGRLLEESQRPSVKFFGE